MEGISTFLDAVPVDCGYADGNGCGADDGFGSSYDNNFYGKDSGDGDGYGYGRGAGTGSDDRYNRGYGYGSGYAYGEGYDDCNGGDEGYDIDDRSSDDINDDYCIKSVNGLRVYMIDNVPTLITSVHNNIAQGYILRKDLTLKPCYIAKINQYYAHGKTAREAVAAAQIKYNLNKPLEERLAEFNKAYPDREKPVPAKELYNWHHILTGSCEMGRMAFCHDHNIDIETDNITVNKFIDLTKYEYGGIVIKQLIKEKE